MVKAVLLGTASAFPTKLRNHPSLYLNVAGKNILFDCGEGTQRQIRAAGLSPSIDEIFITHWHGDHSLGVGGIIQSLNMTRREEQVKVFGPLGTNASVSYILKTYKFYSSLNVIPKSLDLKRDTLIERFGNFSIHGINVKHSVKCIGYKLKEDDSINIKPEVLKKYGIKPGPYLKALKKGKDIKYKGKTFKAKELTYLRKGKSLVYLTDLTYDKSLAKFAKDADVLVIEATFSSDMSEKAKESHHLTVFDALNVAKQANVKKVYLTHLSQRYENEVDSIKKDIGENKSKLKLSAEVVLPNDLCEIEL